MGYRPNRLAAGLRTKRTRTVGLVIPDITNPLFPPIVRGIEGIIEPLGHVSIIMDTDGRLERERSQIRVLLEHGVDGVVHAAVERSDPVMEELRSQELPIVTVDSCLDLDGVPSVVNDDAAGVRAMFALLREAGHGRIAHIAGPQTISTGVARLRAFRQSVASAGLDLPDGDVALSERFAIDEGRRCAHELLSRASPPTAILAANDGLALGVIQAIGERGLRCPDDCSVTGFNDSDVLDLVPPGPTKVAVDEWGIGSTSAELPIGMIEHPDGPWRRASSSRYGSSRAAASGRRRGGTGPPPRVRPHETLPADTRGDVDCFGSPEGGRRRCAVAS
jgi:LacI family transcriptional regulator